MAALGSYLVTLADVAKSKDKQIGKVAEVLMLENPMLQDIPYMEMNEGTVHKESIRSALPAVYYRKANQPIPASKSTIEERTFNAAHFESKSQMDKAVAERGGKDRLAFNRWNQAQGHLQAVAQEQASLLIYGSQENVNYTGQSISALKTPGIMDIYSNLTDETANQIIDVGGSGSDNTSILLAFWGENSLFGIYPKGTTAGLKRTDHSAGGKLVQIYGTDVNSNAGTFWGYEEQFEVDHGLVVKDYRQAARVANIDISALQLQDATSADLLEAMIMAFYKIHNPNNGKGFWYVNRTIEAYLHLQARTQVGASAGLSYAEIDGKPILKFLGIPVRRSDAILNTESAVVA